MSSVFVIATATELGSDKDPRIGYDNQAATGLGVIASHDTSGADYLIDGLTTNKWRPANAAPNVQISGPFANTDYVGIAGCNWATAAASVTVKDSGGNTLATVSGLRDNQPVLLLITKANYTYLTLYFTAANTLLEVGEVYIGESMLLPRNVSTGYKPGRWQFNDEISYSRTVNNQFGPSTIESRGNTENFQVNYITTSYMESTWIDFIQEARGKPIFFLWNKDYPGHTIYGHWSASDPVFVNSLYSSVNMTIDGVS